MRFMLITEVCEPSTGENLATAENYRLSSEKDDFGLGIWELVPFLETVELRAPVFHVGEILIIHDDTLREIPYPGRKANKWSVEYEVFNSCDDALDRMYEINAEEDKTGIEI